MKENQGGICKLRLSLVARLDKSLVDVWRKKHVSLPFPSAVHLLSRFSRQIGAFLVACLSGHDGNYDESPKTTGQVRRSSW